MGDKKSSIGANINSILKWVMVLTCLAAIGFVFPSASSKALKLGEPWPNDDIMATEDLVQSLKQSEINEHLETFKDELGAVYTHDQRTITDVISKLNEVLFLSEDVARPIHKLIRDCYQSGVLPMEHKGQSVSIYRAGEISKIASSSFCSPNNLIDDIELELSKTTYTLDRNTTNRLKEVLQPNLTVSEESKDQLIIEKERALSGDAVLFTKGQKVLAKGEIVSEEVYQSLTSNPRAFSLSNTKDRIFSFFGYFLLTALILLVLIFYVRKYFPQVYQSNRKLSFLLIWPIVFSYLVFAIENYTSLSTYVIPFCIAPILIKNFFEDRLALILHIVIVLIASILSKMGYEFTFIQILAGMVTVLFVSETRYWNKFFLAIGFILLSYLLGILGLNLTSWSSGEPFNFSIYGWLVVNALLLMLAYPFIPLLENIFGFTSSIKLAELSDMNKPLLRELSLRAPGTFQHSLQVANLCEAAAERIGANSLLVKTAALYHDIGKLEKPLFFIENSRGENAHDDLNNNFESAKIIIGHVTNGVEMGIKHRLPKIIIDFIKTHHGTTRVEYFYRNQLNQFPDKEFDESIFRYPGPLPKTKEQTILMLADSVEAASKSLQKPTGQDIDNLIDKIVAFKISEGQLEDSKLSFNELEASVDVFKSMLRSIYHVRVEYPEVN